MSSHSTVLPVRQRAVRHVPPPAPRQRPGVDWAQYVVVAAMALLSMVGYWSDTHFQDLSQGQEWSTDAADAE